VKTDRGVTTQAYNAQNCLSRRAKMQLGTGKLGARVTLLYRIKRLHEFERGVYNVTIELALLEMHRCTSKPLKKKPHVPVVLNPMTS
jgi:hypothetical protein